MSLPIFLTDDKDFGLMQTRWASEINPLLLSPFLQGRLIQNVSLSTGDNVVNHGLNRKLQGWVLVRQRAAATIYDKQDLNQIPNLTLTLNTSANVSVDLYVF